MEASPLEQFEKLGFTVISAPFWEVSAFGGGLHFATADVYREGNMENYIPKQIKGY